MRQIENLIKESLRETYPDYCFVDRYPVWIQRYRWKPSFLLRTKDSKKTLAVDVILSGVIPKYQYSKIVRKVLDDHNNLCAIVVTLERSYEENPEIESLCRAYGIGLKTIIPGVGLQTIVKISLDPELEIRDMPLEEGWFPAAILARAKGLKKLSFHKVINKFVDSVKDIGNNKEKSLALVLKTIDELLRCHPSLNRNFGHFMKLTHFEKLLELTDPEASDHVFHSFRVFLAGCPVINEFYSEFRDAQKPFCRMNEKKLQVGYIWLLTAIFHDIGRPKEGAEKFISDELDDDDLEISVKGKDARWTRQHYITAKQVLGSLGVFVANENEGEEWDGGIIVDHDSDKLTNEWINIYDNMESHAVISALDFLGDLFEKVAAADERKHRPFIVTHAATAAMSILLHDWKIWPKMRKMKLIPLNGSMLPMGALLIYIDTWDNYKRRGKDPLIFINEYVVDPNGAFVRIEWSDLNLMEKDKIAYTEYKKALQNLLFSLSIEYGAVGGPYESVAC